MNNADTTIADLTKQVIDFRDERDWAQFHNPKDLAIALSVEAAEVLELCRFKPTAEIEEDVQQGRCQEFAQELSDVLAYTLTLAHVLHIDLASSFQDKMAINAAHYPVALAKGRKAKYTELQNLCS